MWTKVKEKGIQKQKFLSENFRLSKKIISGTYCNVIFVNLIIFEKQLTVTYTSPTFYNNVFLFVDLTNNFGDFNEFRLVGSLSV